MLKPGDKVTCVQCGQPHPLQKSQDGGTLALAYQCNGRLIIGALRGEPVAGHPATVNGAAAAAAAAAIVGPSSKASVTKATPDAEEGPFAGGECNANGCNGIATHQVHWPGELHMTSVCEDCAQGARGHGAAMGISPRVRLLPEKPAPAPAAAAAPLATTEAKEPAA